MNKFLKVVLLLVAAVSFFGAAIAANLNPFDAKRPFPKQPEISDKAKAKLSAMNLKDGTWYLEKKAIAYYNGENAMEIIRQRSNEGKNGNFTDALPKLQNPSQETVDNAQTIISFAEDLIVRSGAKVVNEPSCVDCFVLKFEYAQAKTGIFETGYMMRARMFFGGEEIAIGRDDWISPEPRAAGIVTVSEVGMAYYGTFPTAQREPAGVPTASTLQANSQ